MDGWMDGYYMLFFNFAFQAMSQDTEWWEAQLAEAKARLAATPIRHKWGNRGCAVLAAVTV